jgi:hypothetical protein
MENLYIGITGHRDIKVDDIEKVRLTFKTLIKEILNTKPNTNINIMSGLAEGADQVITKAAFELIEEGYPIIIIAVLPMSLEEYKNDFKDNELKKFRDLISRLDNHKCKFIELTDDANRVNCYNNLGSYLINNSDFLISIWDGNYNKNLGGTYQVTLSALQTTREDNKSLPVFTIPCTRKSTALSNKLLSPGILTFDQDKNITILDNYNLSDYF